MGTDSIIQRGEALQNAGYTCVGPKTMVGPRVWEDGTSATAKTSLGNLSYAIDGDEATLSTVVYGDETSAITVTFNGSDASVTCVRP